MKRVLAMLLSAIMVMTMVPGMAFADTTDKTVTITGAESPLTYGYTEDQSVTLTARANNFTDTASWQWQEEKEGTWQNIDNATTETYKVPTGLSAGSHNYKCVAKDGADNETGVTSEAVTVTVNAKALTDEMVAFADASENADATYELKDGKAEPEITVKDGETTLTADTDYTVEYSDNKAVTEAAKVTVTGKGNYSGAIPKTFKIVEPQVDITGATVTLDVPETGLTYNGTAQKPAVKEVKVGETVLTTADYTVEYSDNTDAGTATVTVTGKGNYTGTATETFTITKLTVTELAVELEKAEAIYDGNAQAPVIKSVKAGEVTLQEKDYTVSYAKKDDTENTPVQEDAVKDAGNYVVSIEPAAEGNCTGTAKATAEYTIKPVNVEGQKVTLTYDDKDASGALNKDDTVTADITTVTPANDAVTYQWMKDGVAIKDATGATYTLVETDAEGVLTCEVTFTGNTTGKITSDALEIGKKLLTGDIAITEAEGVLTVSTPTNAEITAADYAIAWYRDDVVIDNATEKTYTITKPEDLGKTITAVITGKGDYTGTLYADGYSVPAEKPAAPVITATAGNKAVTVKWTKPEENGAPIEKYELTVTKEVAADPAPTTPDTPAVTAEGDGTPTEPATKAEGITGSPFTIDADKTEYTVTGLENGTEYTFTLTATNEAGTSDASKAVKATPKVPAPIQYTIKYIMNGGINSKLNPAKYTKETATFTLKNPTRKGYTFGGWYTSSKFTAASKVTSIKKGSTGNKTLYAKWTATTYKITYYANKGTLAKGTQKSYKITTATFTLKNPTRKGYTFGGWYTSSKFKTKATRIAKGSTGNKVFYAKWNKVTVAKAKTPVLTNLKGRSLRIKYSATTGAKGYQIQYSTSKKFTKAVTKTTTAKTYTAKKLKKGKTYYVRVRAYKTDSKGYKVYGSWSTVKSKKITK